MKKIHVAGRIHNVNFTSVPLEGSDCRLNGNPTVSYTHLDVYKRQAYTCL